MSEVAPSFDLLSRDEIGALLDELRHAREQEQESRRLPGLGVGVDDPGPMRELRRGLERFAVDHSRLLASRFQRRLALELTDVEEQRATELAELLLAHERVAVFRIGHEGRGYVWIPRALLTAWWRLAFGARRALRPEVLPDRALTPIERRFLRSAAGEVVTAIGAALGVDVSLESIDDASALRDARAVRLLVAAFDVSGLEEIGRIRVALSRDLLDEGAARTRAESNDGDAVEQAVLDAEVLVTAVAGHGQMPLSRLAALAVGDLLAVEDGANDLLTLTVDGAPKFRAQRGRVGTRLALQVVERLTGTED
jgi:flagellar motor switch protein FliM